MEGVSTVMPMAVRTGAGILSKALAESGKSGASDVIEARAQSAELQAKRQAEAERRGARDRVEEMREASQHRNASARVAAANSGLALSGSSLLSLTALEGAGDARVNKELGDSALRIQSLLDSGAEQAHSIRLSGRSVDSRLGGLGSLLRLGGQSLGNW
ncbi:MAG: hypothetical protein Q8O35_11560 [Humidesulfovibrio sp.]|jgi:hypothetical protein|uniref:hypothetical protein n=1 Tax=Humidesulfovibrio sp. TaxID=2910988 RepID=UPI002736C39B|nr:hypothetical protein [Humidesulfovibrio sp.]MDP2848810.1 hypothetical protein [Humidesulfovibrio sp.]